MKKKKPSLPTDPDYLARLGRVGKHPPKKEWYVSLVARLMSLSRREIIILSIVVFLLVLLIWRPQLQYAELKAVAGCLILVAISTGFVIGLIRDYNQRQEAEFLSRWASKKKISRNDPGNKE